SKQLFETRASAAAERANAIAERARAERAEASAAVERERAAREAHERALIEEAEQHGEVLRLAMTPGRERDALALGVEVLAPRGDALEDAPSLVLEGLSRALPALIPSATVPLDRKRPVVIAPDGQSLAVGGPTLQVWSFADGQLVQEIDTGDVTTEVCGYSPDGRLLLTRALEVARPSCDLWDARSGAHALELPGCADPKFSTDGALVLGKRPPSEGLPPSAGVGFGDTYVALVAWDASTGETRWATPTPGENFGYLLHPDGRRVIVKHDHLDKERVEVLELASGSALRRLPLPEHAPKYSWRTVGFFLDGALALSRSGALLASVNTSERSGLHLWDLETGEHRQLGRAQGFPSVEFSPDDARLVVTGRQTQVFDVRAGAPVTTSALSGAAEFVTGDLFLTLNNDDELTLWDEPTGRSLRTTATGEPTESWTFGADGALLATSGSKGLRSWYLEDPLVESRWAPPAGETITFLANEITTRDEQGRVRLYDVGAHAAKFAATDPDPKAGATVENHDLWSTETGYWSSSSIMDHGRFLGHAMRFFDKQTGAVLIDVPDPEHGYRGPYPEPAEHAAVAAELITVDNEPLLRIHDLRRGPDHARTCELPPRGDRWSAKNLRISHDGGTAAMLDLSGEVTFIDVDSCAPRVTVPAIAAHEAALDENVERFGFFRYLRTFTFTDDGTLFVSHLGRTVAIDPVSGRLRAEIEHSCADDPYREAYPSPDGQHVVTHCPRERDARIWHVDSASLVARLELPDERPVFSPDGARLGHFINSGEIAVVRVEDGAEVVRLRARGGFPGSRMRFTPDGASLQMLAQDGAVNTYPATRVGLVAAACRALARTELADEVADACASSSAARRGS
ncbi:MAG: WD40 repeat domain-containing protein, partial [Myxococcales bacterium]|nr:WD40 repeat domain-containing protein [Myxococcales bacterium]